MEAKDKYEKANEEYIALTTKEVALLDEKKIEEFIAAGISSLRIKNDMKLCKETLIKMGLLKEDKKEKDVK